VIDLGRIETEQTAELEVWDSPLGDEAAHVPLRDTELVSDRSEADEVVGDHVSCGAASKRSSGATPTRLSIHVPRKGVRRPSWRDTASHKRSWSPSGSPDRPISSHTPPKMSGKSR
jgi:hypothetical protein